MGYHMTVNDLFKVLCVGKEDSRSAIDRIDVSRNGWTKWWGRSEVPNMLGEIGEMNVLCVRVFNECESSTTVLAIDVA